MDHQRYVKKKIILGKYEVSAIIGRGTYGTVKRGLNLETGEEVAVKTVKYKNIRDAKDREQIEREKKIIAQLDHPNIVKLLDLIEFSEKQLCYMVFEYVPGGDLFQYLQSKGRLDETEARRLFRQIVSALEYCHFSLIVHRDLKPENILLDRNCNVKISDFGFANIITPGEKFRSFCGSLLYAAPEILAGLPYSGPFVDLWSLGVILYTMVCGRQPFTGESPQEAIAKILNVQYEFPDYLSEDCRDLIRKLLVKEEKKRLPISAIRQHDWVNVGYLRPPPSYLRVSDYNAPVSSIYEEIMQQLTELGFHDTPEARKEILCGRKTQLVATYHALLNRLTHPKDAVVVPSPLKRSPSPLSRSPPKHTAVETRKRANSVDELKLPALNLKQSSPQPTSALSPRLRVISRQSKSATAIRRLASSPPKGETVEKSASPSPPLSPRSRLISSPTKSATTIRPLSSSPLKEIAEEPLLPLKEGDTSDFSELSAPRKDPWSAPVYGGPRLANANSGYLDILD